MGPHAVTHGTNLAVGIHRCLLVNPGHKGAGISDMGFRVQGLGHWQDNTADFRVAETGAFGDHW